MSDIMASAEGRRAANGGARAAQGPIPVPAKSDATPVSRAAVIPPTEIMRRREERARAQQERAQASSEAERRRLQSEWDGYDTDPGASAGGVASPPPPVQQQVPPPQQPQTSATQHRRTQSAAQPQQRISSGQSATSGAYPQQSGQPGQQPSSYSPSGQPLPQSQKVPSQVSQGPAPGQSTSRPRASTNNPQQPRASHPSNAPMTGNPPRQQNPQPQRQSAATQPQLRPPQEPPEVRAERQRLAQEAGMSAGTSAEQQGRRGDGSVSTFPHAFERWEMLSSKWEGMTSHWISRLQMNSEELQNQPMLAQLSRQVTDLSAAGANLFTALVELQRLRASSERKFQRWFHDTRNEMERQQELVGQLERALIQERRDRADDQVNWEKLVDNARRTEHNFSRLNVEKDRELQIAKDESRRAWEELGRYEALERERQKALAQGLPVEIGGYTVYPRLFPESRQGSVSQPQSTRTDPRPTSRRDAQASQPIQDDPFVADYSAADALQDRPEDEAYTPPRTQAYTQSGSQPYSSAAYTTDGGYTSFSAPPPAGGGLQQSPGGGFYSQQNLPLDHPSDEDFEYERDDAGNILTDEYGRPLSYRRGLHEVRSFDSVGDAHDSADQRRRHPAMTSQGHPGVSGAAGPSMQTRPEADFGFFNEEEEDDPEGRYTGAGYGQPDEEDGQHYHPTRLSDVPEEDELSRVSEAGGSRHGGGVGIINVTGAPF